MILPSGLSTYDYSVASHLKGWGPGWPNCGIKPTRTVTATRSGTQWFQMHTGMADLFEILVNEIERRGYMFVPGWNWGGQCRPIAGTDRPSNHSWFIAGDLNAPKNPYTSLGVHDIPDWAYAIFRAYGFGVGADYTGSKKDWMHVEFMGTPDDATVMTFLAYRAFNGLADPVAPVHEQQTPSVGNVVAPKPQPTPPPPPAPAPAVGSDWLRLGFNSDRVKLLQQRLIVWGFLAKGQDDGDFGPKTDKAVRDFQASKGLVVDGIVGPKTWDAVNTNPAPAPFPGTVQKGSTGNIVKDVQDRLVERGFISREKVNTGYGTFGPATDAAVRAFQKSKGLAQDGIVGPNTWKALHN